MKLSAQDVTDTAGLSLIAVGLWAYDWRVSVIVLGVILLSVSILGRYGRNRHRSRLL